MPMLVGAQLTLINESRDQNNPEGAFEPPPVIPDGVARIEFRYKDNFQGLTFPPPPVFDEAVVTSGDADVDSSLQ